ncbi:MAG: VCBS repeat-containing protein [Phycisphaerales bacterium]|nr:MAG: VCBS repeat-containing protein [Phycisphaerales bacterium]
MDWNNDGKKDLISGDTKGQVWVFLNTATDEAPELAEGVRVQAGGEPIIAARYAAGRSLSNAAKKMGTYSKLHYGDWDGDGLKDLLIGQDGTSQSQVVFYKNIGTESEPKFDKLEILSLPGPKMSRPSPYVVDWDADGKQDMLFGTERAEVYFFRNVGTNREPELEAGKKLALAGGDFSKGYRCRIDVTDWNEDGKLDLLVGNFYSQTRPVGGNVWLFLGL